MKFSGVEFFVKRLVIGNSRSLVEDFPGSRSVAIVTIYYVLLLSCKA